MRKSWNYRSPDLTGPDLGHLFPHRIVSDVNLNDWSYLRREVPHSWYADSRVPWMGFLSTDEAALLYALARPFAGKPGLEIGTWRGWSSAHLASAGLVLDLIDPEFEDVAIYDEVHGVMKALGAGDRVRLNPGKSPDLIVPVQERRGEPWNFVFIDGNHEPPGPVLDATNVVRFLADDALVVFHDLASPHVTAGFGVLRDLGWNVVVFQTMQIMGAAWRGHVVPVAHVPDPAVDWKIPEHLQSYPISGEDEVVRAARFESVLRGHVALLQEGASAVAERDSLRIALQQSYQRSDALYADIQRAMATIEEMDRDRASRSTAAGARDREAQLKLEDLRSRLCQYEQVLALETDSVRRLTAELSRVRAERRAVDAERLRVHMESGRIKRVTRVSARKRMGDAASELG